MSGGLPLVYVVYTGYHLKGGSWMSRYKRYMGLLLSALMVALPVSFASADNGLDEQAIEEGWRAFQAEHGESHASGGRPEFGPQLIGNPTTAVQVLRIGLRYSYTPTGARSEFYSYNHPQVQVTGTLDAFHVIDKATGKQISAGNPGEIFTVSHNGTSFVVTGPDGAASEAAGPVYFRSSNPANTFKVPSITRLNILTYANWLTPEYRGEMEVARGTATPAGYVNLVNVVELESYLKGNVVNESPAFFHVEALKTQAVAARGYAVANIGRFVRSGYPFDLDDSAGSQVYRGKTSEHPNGNAAVDGTKGIVASYNGKIISAFYSSSMAGHTENYEWTFSGTGNQAQAVPYLKGRYDGPAGTEPDLTTEEGLRAFWASEQAQVYDSRTNSTNPRNRWSFTLSRATLESKLNAVKSFARVISGSSASIGTLQGCEITLRSPSGRAVKVRCTGSNAVWEFWGWDHVRRAFPHPTWGTLNNPAFLDHNRNADGSLESITIIGGGWGHNTGMSQYGANGRGKAGQNFAEIMAFYYKDTVLGSYPIDVKHEPGTGPRTLRQEFVTPTGYGVLELRPTGALKGMNILINETHELKLTEADLAQPLVRINLQQYLAPGQNVIQYNPVGKEGGATALVVIAE